MVVFNESCSFLAEMVVFVQNWLYSSKVVVLG